MRHALLQAALEAIRDSLGYTKHNSGRTLNGQPYPKAGKVFVSVHGGARQSIGDNRLDEYYSFQVTISVRVASPFDRTEYVEVDELTERADAIRVLIHKNELIRIRANEIIGPGNSGFVESQMFLGDSDPRYVGGDWWHAMPEEVELGVVQTLQFGRARRIQRLEGAA